LPENQPALSIRARASEVERRRQRRALDFKFARQIRVDPVKELFLRAKLNRPFFTFYGERLVKACSADIEPGEIQITLAGNEPDGGLLGLHTTLVRSTIHLRIRMFSP